MWRKVDLSPLSRAQAKNDWSYAAFMCLNCVDKDNITLFTSL